MYGSGGQSGIGLGNGSGNGNGRSGYGEDENGGKIPGTMAGPWWERHIVKHR